MRIKRVELRDYKRFTHLEIPDIPETARLVVLVGPNGCGKSSVFDAFISKARAEVANVSLTGNLEQYFEKEKRARHLHDIAQRIDIEFYGRPPDGLKSAFQVRSAYRNEADFRIDHIQTKFEGREGPRLSRIIDIDSAVSENYQYLTWKGLQDLYHAAQPETTFEQYRIEALGELHDAMRHLFPDPALLLQDFGAMRSGSFRFGKGSVQDFHYKNLSGGEKATFDILLDVFVKRHEFPEAIFCIDEPELHVATALQGRMLAAVLDLLPVTAQLWIATHSIGVVREAFRIYENTGEVAFLDFFDCGDLDRTVTVKERKPNRAFWANVYNVALDDLSALVAPRRICLCEGSEDRADKGFDAECYNRLFADEHYDTLFISRGSASQVVRQPHLKAIIKAIASDVEIIELIDRDDMTDGTRRERIDGGTRVPRRRALENYLWDPEVLRNFLASTDCDPAVAERILEEWGDMIPGEIETAKIKSLVGEIYQTILKKSKLSKLGNTYEEFAKHFLVDALRKTPSVYNDLRDDVFHPRKSV
ncbi:MAG: AAA family ATPase [Rhodobacter sp.]|nr:AAA family ATPase [Rhodobacter sp.]